LRRLFLITLFLWTDAAQAEGLISDAWGLSGGGDPMRSQWAGWQQSEGPAGVATAPGAGTEVLFFLGAKSLVAGDGIAMAAAIVLDGQGNLVTDGTGVTMTLDRAVTQVTTTNGIAALTFTAGTKAGQYHAGAAIAGVQSGRAEYVVTPDMARITPRLLADDRLGQTEDFHDLVTAPMADPYGNTIIDGAGLMFVMQGDAGATTLLPAIAAGGVAKGRVLARDLGAGGDLSGQMRVTLADQTAPALPYQIRALRAEGRLPMRSEQLFDLQIVHVTLGPFLTDAGHALNDGAPVSALARLADGRELAQNGWLLDGIVTLDWLATPADLPMVLTVTTPLGTEVMTLTDLTKGGTE
jgi:hypothetical protein